MDPSAAVHERSMLGNPGRHTTVNGNESVTSNPSLYRHNIKTHRILAESQARGISAAVTLDRARAVAEGEGNVHAAAQIPVVHAEVLFRLEGVVGCALGSVETVASWEARLWVRWSAWV